MDLNKKNSLEIADKIIDSRQKSQSELTSSLIHEVVNQISILSCTIEDMEDILEENPKNHDELNIELAKLKNKLTSMKEKLNSYRSVFRIRKETVESLCNLEELINDAKEVSQRIFKRNSIVFTCENPPKGEILSDFSQFTQALIAVLQNAIEAAAKSEEKWVHLNFKTQGNSIYIIISNSGDSIPQDNSKEIFNAFYTTKPEPHHLGLGLYYSKKVFESSGGQISLDTDAPHTTFMIQLPFVS